MRNGPDMAGVAAMVADPARAHMLAALMDKRALTAGELAAEAGVTPQTASGHLAKLRAAGFVVVEAQGRHRYFRIAGPDISAVLESLLVLAARTGAARTRPGPRDERLRQARRCYDHLAGTAGVRMLDAFLERGVVEEREHGLAVTAAGEGYLVRAGLDLAAPGNSRRPFCRSCLDWSERRPHLAGLLGARLFFYVVGRGWCRSEASSRVVAFTPDGGRAFERFIAGAA